MKNVLTLIVAGMMLASGAFARDFAFEERFRAKVGRYTRAEEARRASNTASANQNCDMPSMGCCHRSGHKLTNATGNPWLAAKHGTAQPFAARMDCEHNTATGTLTVVDIWKEAKFGITPAVNAEAKATRTATCCD